MGIQIGASTHPHDQSIMCSSFNVIKTSAIAPKNVIPELLIPESLLMVLLRPVLSVKIDHVLKAENNPIGVGHFFLPFSILTTPPRPDGWNEP